MEVVADTSALVSLGTVADRDPNPLDHLLAEQDVSVPAIVFDELEQTAAYDDTSGHAANRVLGRRSSFSVRDATLDETFPLDDGENAAVTLANDRDADQFLCDEFNRLALVHASLVDTRLVTTPVLLVALTRAGAFSADDAGSLLAEMSDARTWTNNAYVARARDVLRDQ